MPDISSSSSFTTLLASSIHDMKNSLSLVINTLDRLVEDNGKPVDPSRIPLLQFEARRINEHLIQLLTLYKSENNILEINIAEHNIADFLDEVTGLESPVAEARGITLNCNCEETLAGYFDSELITSVLRNALHNAIRHTNDSITITARQNDDQSVTIKVLDNGQGLNPAADIVDTKNSRSSQTGLGLHFCSISAKLHTNKGKQGYVSIDNRTDQCGAVFTLYIP